MKDTILISLFALSIGFIGGFKTKSNIDSQKQQPSVKEATTHLSGYKPVEGENDKFIVYRNGGDTVLYSVILPDGYALDFLTISELNKVLTDSKTEYNQ